MTRRLLFVIISLTFSFPAIDALTGARGEAADPWVSGPEGTAPWVSDPSVSVSGPWVSPQSRATPVPRKTAVPEEQIIRDKIKRLENKRENEMAALKKRKAAAIKVLEDQLERTLEREDAVIKRERKYILREMYQGKDMTRAQAALRQKEQSLMKKVLNLKKQIYHVETNYDHQISRLVQTYDGQIAILKKRLKTEE